MSRSLTVFILLLLPWCAAWASAAPVIHLIGDSTMADKPRLEHPERGWGQLFKARVRPPARVVNHAQNGRSTKSFIDEGRWQTVLDQLQPGDWVIIQFGHNDEKVDSPKRYTDPHGSYRDNLRRFIRESLERGAFPVLATSVARRRWNDAGQLVPTHGDYPDAVRAVARETGVPLLELEERTAALEQTFGVEGSKALHLWFAAGELATAPEGLSDDTHYSELGARLVADLAVDEIRRRGLALAEWLFTPPDAVVALDGTGDHTSIEQAVYAAPQKPAGWPRWVILVKPGVYRERVYVQRERGNIALIGEDAATTILVYGMHANMTDAEGKKIGTFRTPTLQVDGDGFVVENMTIANDAGPVGQALALRVDGDRVVFRHCRFLGWQDTILVNRGRHLFADCYIEGHVDFIFGAANSVFERCHIHCVGNGYITAASTPADQTHGLTFLDCRITGAEGVRTYLGRPWRAHAQTTFVRTEMSDVVHVEGWHNWNQPDREITVRYAEYGSVGPGAAAAARVGWARTLSPDEATALTAAAVLAGDDGWQIPLPISR